VASVQKLFTKNEVPGRLYYVKKDGPEEPPQKKPHNEGGARYPKISGIL
jgi:hypothetical protein